MGPQSTVGGGSAFLNPKNVGLTITLVDITEEKFRQQITPVLGADEDHRGTEE